LVVVAIIALLISILLPSLNRARAQARSTMCLSRLSQLVKAFIMYAEDYEEVFPFTSSMHDSFAMGPNTIETWMVNWGDYQSAEAIALAKNIALNNQEQWDEPELLKTGTLFSYSRFENLYRCPDFERQASSEQNVFNYTRAVWARFWKLAIEFQIEGGASESNWGDVRGPIMKTAQLHNPTRLPMLLDEHWERHVGTAGNLGDNGSAYNAGDYGFFADNVIALSHGSPTTCRYHDWDIDWRNQNYYEPFLWPRGGIACYDGHAELARDPWPTYESGKSERNQRWDGKEQWRLGSMGGREYDEIWAIMEYMQHLIYAQRGFDPVERFRNQYAVVPWGVPE